MSTHRAFETPSSENWPVPLGPTGYRLFPFAVCRVAAQPFDHLRSLRSPSTIAAQAGLETHEAHFLQAREELEGAFHQAVGSAADKPQRRLLLAAARNLRRRGKLSPAQEELLSECGSRDLLQAMAHWRRSERRVRQAERELEETHGRERASAGRSIGRLADDPMFSKALALSSPVLYRTWRQAQQRDGEITPRNRARRRLEASLLKYYTRSATKTTPFSSFTWIARATLALDGAGRQKRLIGLPDGKAISATSLNKTLYSVLHRSLRGDREIFGCFAVTLNPSLVESPSGFTMLLAQAGNEKTVQLPAVPAIRLAAEILSGRGGTCPYREFVERLATDLRVMPAQLEPRIQRMVEAGILQLNSSIADYELDWVPILEAQLAPSSSAAVEEVRRLLRRLDAQRQRFETLDADGRLELLEKSGQEIEPLISPSAAEPTARNAAGEQGEESAPAAGMLVEHKAFLRRNLFYEDTFLDRSVRVDTHRLLPAFEELTEWADWMSHLSLHWAYHANMRAYFDRRFEGVGSAPFLDFYRGFLAEVYEPILRFERDASSGQFVELANPFGLERLPNAIRAANRLRRLVAERWAARPQAETLQLRYEDLEAIAARPERAHGPSSVTLFVQLLQRASVFEKDALLVDQQTVHAGMGRYFSRFLYRLGGRFTHDLQAHNSRFDDVLVAELCDDGEFSFNGNLHPPLTDWEINYPATLTGLRGDTNIPLAELDVRPDAEAEQRLQLIHRGLGKVVLPVDLGFVNPLRRPPLFRVLELFSPSAFHRIYFPWSFDGSTAPPRDEAPRVIYRPRVVYGKRVVLSRRSWLVPAEALRQVVDGKGPAASFHALRRWSATHSLPEDVFFHTPRSGLLRPVAMMRAAPDEGEETATEAEPDAAGKWRRRPTHKPQYLSFHSACLCELLLEAVKDHPGYLAFEEMLPSPRMLAERRGHSHATELVVQLDRDPS